MPENQPETFDFDEWFADANLPTESADIYTRADVVGDIRDLERRIEVETEIDVDTETVVERALGEKPQTSALDQLIAARARLFKQFEESKITVYVRALTGRERQEIRTAHDEAKEHDEEFVFRLLSQSIVAMQKHGRDKTDATLSIDQVRDLYRKVGDAQIFALRNAYLQATNAAPEVSADFLHSNSSPENTQE